ncbi:MAG: bifunctional (p)ppGpp synthetase/guanosine-3',5'-bis(diphosphate) 3'-pyrophosphohydrolase [Halanaerobacter sp.]
MFLDKLLTELLTEIKSYMDEPDIELVKEAYYYAQECHEGQERISGEPFVSHPLNVARLMAEFKLDITSIVAALLHDTVEDTGATLGDIREKFGSEIGVLVNGVTKLNKMDFESKEEHQAESLRKMFLAMAKDIRVVLIKLVDRLHNMRTLNYLREEKQKRKATETIEIYAPLAHRLGISQLKWELEDLSFRYLEPEKYKELSNKVDKDRTEREAYIEEVNQKLSKELDKIDIEAKIYGRPKHLYSIYQKMVNKNKRFDEIYDLTALRVIVDTVKECYEVLGTIHDLWSPMPGRIKDYIAMPKSNMYQSLHTTVVTSQGETLEIQIRTWEMHRTAEYGIAAHWRYKDGKPQDEKFEEKISWLRQLLEWQRDLTDAEEFMETLKVDLFEDEVFAFTPEGDVVSLPKDSTPVDFAYDIHTEVGHNCIGAKANENMVPLEYRIQNGDIIEILTNAESGPSRDWLDFVQTSKAKSKIKRWFKHQRKEEVAERGKEILEKELKKRNINLSEDEKEKKLKEIAPNMGVSNIEGLYSAMGYDKVSVKKVVHELEPETKEEEKSPQKEIQKLRKKHKVQKDSSSNQGVKVKGMDDLLVRIAKCCNPVPGDEIGGYITRGRGVSIHRKDCPNFRSLKESEEERTIDVEWYVDEDNSYQVELEVEALDKHSLLNDVTKAISEEGVNITGVDARTSDDGIAHINLGVHISSLEHMNKIIDKLEFVDGVLKVRRANPS